MYFYSLLAKVDNGSPMGGVFFLEISPVNVLRR